MPSLPPDDDWRLEGRGEDLLDAQLTRAIYVPPSADWDHDHCEFCWAKFMATESPDVQRMGYKTDTDDHWICDDCFEDFKTRFRWTVRS